MSERRSNGRCESADSTIPQSFPAQQCQVTGEELDNLVDSFIDLIIDGFIEQYRSGQLDLNKLKLKGGKVLNK